MADLDQKTSRQGRTRVSRRDFLRVGGGVIASSAILGAPAILTGCGRGSNDDKPDILTVATNEVITLDAFSQIEDPEGLDTTERPESGEEDEDAGEEKNEDAIYEVRDIAQYPQGTMLFSSDNRVAAALCTGETASPLSTCSLVDLETGDMTPALERAVNHSQGYSIFAVRASKDLLLWVESNYLTSWWMVYCASINEDRSIGQPVKLDEGDWEYDTPEIAVIGQNAYWIVQPSENGPRTKEDSYLKVASGGSRSANVITSHGRFNGGLSTSGQVLTAMPRADVSDSVYYELTAISAGSGSIIATQVLPHSYRPSNAIYMGNAFAFTIPASYDYGGGIANVGTYYPMAGNEWLRLAKQSLTPPGMCNGWLFAKSGSRTVFIDLKQHRYFVVNPPDGCEDYGDYSVCTGEVSQVYNYATVGRVEDSKRYKLVMLRSILPKAAM